MKMFAGLARGKERGKEGGEMEVIIFNVSLIASVIAFAEIMKRLKDAKLSRAIDDFNRKSS